MSGREPAAYEAPARSDGPPPSPAVAVPAAAASARRFAREVEEQLAVALDLSGLGRYTIYLREPRVDADARYCEIIGCDAQEFMTAEGLDGLFDLVHADDLPRIRAVFETAAGDLSRFEAEYRIWQVTSDGPALRRVVTRGCVESDEHGPYRMIGVVDDITEAWVEEQRRVTRQKREALGSLTAGIAHDFNNVISAILSNAHLADHELASGQSPATSIAEIQRGARRAGELVGRMAALSREQEPVREPLDLGEVAREAAALLRATLPPTTSLTVDIRPSIPGLLGDSTQMHQVIVNLLTNAVHAVGHGGGSIELTVDTVAVTAVNGDGVAPGPYVRLRVQDDGVGIPEAVLPRIFDPFYTTKPVGEGTGLGLATAQTIVHGHGGVMAVRSPPGAGTTFTLHLPLARPAERDAPSVWPRREAPTVVGAGPALRLLFVDDERALTELAERAMPLLGCRVTVSNEPRLAAELFERNPDAFDAVVTDLSMPGLSGIEFLERAKGLRPGLATVLTSGYLSAEARADAARLEVDAIVLKPCSMDDIVTAARTACEARCR